jgi:predicted O-linked N-acetylglucosamine transferase (SPINDLY family)
MASKVAGEGERALRLADNGRLPEAVAILQDLYARNPDRPGILINLGALHTRAGQLTEAISSLQEATRALPNQAEAWNNLGNACLYACRMEAAYSAFSKAIALKPDYFAAHSNRFLVLRYRHAERKTTDRAVRDWEAALRQFPVGDAWQPDSFKPLEGKCRIGFISPDFRTHSVAYFLEPLLDHLDRRRFELILFSDVRRPDAKTARFEERADRWIPTKGLSDAEVLQVCRAQQLYALVDLCGHFEDNRLPVFAARAAPLQLSWLGYPGSTATPNIDGVMGDRSLAAPTDKPAYLLPDGHHCYRPPSPSPPIKKDAPDGYTGPTLACFNNACKITPATAGLWGRILRAVPDSRLLLKARAFNDPEVAARIREWIGKGMEIAPERIIFLPRSPSIHDHLKTYNQVDLCLDTFPYNGTTTTCEALWMGVPTVSLKGQPPQSRVGASLLRQVALMPFVVQTSQAYVETAAALLQRPSLLQNLRATLRSRMQKTPLMNEAAFARKVETCLTRNLL